MACTIDFSKLSDLTSACNVAFGGIKGVKVQGGTKIISIEFNPSDAFSNASETKTVSMDGTVSVAQTLQLELPRFDEYKYERIKTFANPNMELKVYILTKSGSMITYGAEFGCYLQTVDVASGTGRQDKNRIQLTFTGDEASLAPIGTEAEFNALVADAADDIE